MIELIPKTAKPNIPPEMKSSKIPWLGVKSIKKYALPIKKLSIPIPIIVYFVFSIFLMMRIIGGIIYMSKLFF